jgi:hypothetical protein
MEWRPPVARPAAQDQLVILGCRVRQMVAVVARAVTARVLLAGTVPWASTVGTVSSPLVCSYGDNGATGMEEPNMEVLCVEEPSGFQ